MNSLKKKALSTKLFVLFLMVALMPPPYLRQLSAMLDFAFIGVKVVAYIVIMIYCFEDIRILFREKFIRLLLLLWIELFFTTLFSHDATLYNYFTNATATLFPTLMVIELALHSPKNGLTCLYYFFAAYTLINTITFVLVPGALYADNLGWRCWFLGDDNTGYSYYIIASTLAMIYCLCIKKHITILSVAVWLSAFIFAFGRELGTGRMCQVLWLGLFVLYHFNWFKRVFKARYVLYIMIGGFLGIVIFRKLIFESIITAIGKDITLSGRTILWDNAIKTIQQKPLFGYGIFERDNFSKLVSINLFTAHNYILQLLMYGGITAALIFVLLVCVAGRVGVAERKSDYCKCVIIGLFLLSVRLIVEAGNNYHLYILLAMLAYSKEFLLGLKNAS